MKQIILTKKAHSGQKNFISKYWRLSLFSIFSVFQLAVCFLSLYIYYTLLKILFEKDNTGFIAAYQKFLSRIFENLKTLSMFNKFENGFNNIIAAFDFQTQTSFIPRAIALNCMILIQAIIPVICILLDQFCLYLILSNKDREALRNRNKAKEYLRKIFYKSSEEPEKLSLDKKIVLFNIVFAITPSFFYNNNIIAIVYSIVFFAYLTFRFIGLVVKLCLAIKDAIKEIENSVSQTIFIQEDLKDLSSIEICTQDCKV